LFNIAIESIIRKVLSQAKGIQIGNNKDLIVVSLSDDKVLIAETEDELKNTKSILSKEEKEIGLNINEANIKYMILSNKTKEQVI